MRPCRQIAPAIDALATEYAGKVKVGKLDVDANGETAMRYNVRGIPTLLLFKGGQVVEQRVGRGRQIRTAADAGRPHRRACVTRPPPV